MAPKNTGLRTLKHLTTAGMGIVAAMWAMACTEAGIGDPCIPEDEYQVGFAGYNEKEVSVESRSFQCETRLCLVNKFRGRVSCKYGQTASQAEENPVCTTPDGQEDIEVPVDRQLVDRRPIESVYCSCRCAGVNGVTDDGAPYCECPSGFRCEDLIDDWQLGDAQLAGAYCVKEGSNPSPDAIDNIACQDGECGDRDDPYN